MRRGPAIAAALACALFAGCSGVMDRPPGRLAQSLPSDPPTLNPVLATDTTSGEINNYVYESLLDRDNATLELKPRLAESWEISPDHLSYTFRLRRGVRWHDGAPFTADDVAYTFERIMDPKVDAASLRNYFRDVKRVDKLGDHAVRVVYSEPYFKALEIIGGATILPRHVFDDGQDFNSHPANRMPIGTGPFRFEEWKTGRVIKLVRNEEYWGEKPDLSGFTFEIIPDQNIRFEMLKKGASDVEGLRPIQWARQTGGDKFLRRFDKRRYWMPNYSYIGWNTQNPLFSDRRVRHAMTMLTNRTQILEKILLGQGEIVASGFYKFGPQYDPSIEPLPYDPAAARRLLAEAGWADHDGDGIIDKDGLPFRFTLLAAAGSSFARSLALILREDLARVGIDMSIRQLEWATMLKLLTERSFEATQLAWSLPITQDPYQLWHSSQRDRGSNFIGFSDPRVDEIVERARREFDEAKRDAMYREFQRIVHEEQPYTFLFINPSLVAVSKRFGNVVDYRLGLDPREWVVEPWERLIQW
ncbi:MAG: peptide-binding protein [Proteobacteria bacterium]|nr:peptide-binding protein [Pseudomonadota bacterium]